MNYNLVVCGGTFDLFHSGHKRFLQEALNVSNKVLLGITSDKYISTFKNNHSESLEQDIEEFETRKKTVTEFLKSIEAIDKVEIITIDTPDEPLLENKYSPDAIVVTRQTKNTANIINEKRKLLGFPSIEIIVFEMEKAEDGELITSTRIRKGEINREGRLFIRKDWRNKTLILPQSLRFALQKPFGNILSDVPERIDSAKTITIGDISAQKFNEKNHDHFLSVIDFTVQRQKKFAKLSDLGFDSKENAVEIVNQAGTLAWELFESIQEIFNLRNGKIILVDGEEDLAVLPVLLIAPLGFVIYYGQPNEGLIELKVTEENKEKAYQLVNKFI